MVNSLLVLTTLGLGPPAVFAGGADLIDSRVGSFSWSFADRSSSFGFGSNEFGDWSYGEISIRQPLVDFAPVPRTYGAVGGGLEIREAPLIELPVRRGWWPRRQKFKIKVKSRGW